MKRINTSLATVLVILVALITLHSCKKAMAESEQLTTSEEIATQLTSLAIVTEDGTPVGHATIASVEEKTKITLVIDQNFMEEHTSGFKSNITMRTAEGTTMYAHLTAIDGKQKAYETYPVVRASNNTAVPYKEFIATPGLRINLDNGLKIVAWANNSQSSH